MPHPDPIAFMSSARFDDQHEEGRLSEFRERLSAKDCKNLVTISKLLARSFDRLRMSG